MKEENVRQAIAAVSGKIPQEKLMYFKNKLAATDDGRLDEILCADIYNPTHILLFSIFLGGLGIDRFLIGDIGLGIAKLLFGWITFGIWPLIAIFFSYKKAKEKNFNNLMTLI